MNGFLVAVYPWVKVLHIVSVVAWMAGLLYLPRLFVYHAEARPGSDTAKTFEIMERRLFYGIMSPAMIATLAFGAALAATPGVVEWREGWIWAKLALVAGLIGFHHGLGRWRKHFAAGAPPHTARFFRAVNEMPMLVLIAIVILVVIKPF